jgi:hypothetical protein
MRPEPPPEASIDQLRSAVFLFETNTTYLNTDPSFPESLDKFRREPRKEGSVIIHPLAIEQACQM